MCPLVFSGEPLGGTKADIHPTLISHDWGLDQSAAWDPPSSEEKQGEWQGKWCLQRDVNKVWSDEELIQMMFCRISGIFCLMCSNRFLAYSGGYLGYWRARPLRLHRVDWNPGYNSLYVGSSMHWSEWFSRRVGSFYKVNTTKLDTWFK